MYVERKVLQNADGKKSNCAPPTVIVIFLHLEIDCPSFSPSSSSPSPCYGPPPSTYSTHKDKLEKESLRGIQGASQAENASFNHVLKPTQDNLSTVFLECASKRGAGNECRTGGFPQTRLGALPSL